MNLFQMEFIGLPCPTFQDDDEKNCVNDYETDEDEIYFQKSIKNESKKKIEKVNIIYNIIIIK